MNNNVGCRNVGQVDQIDAQCAPDNWLRSQTELGGSGLGL